MPVGAGLIFCLKPEESTEAPARTNTFRAEPTSLAHVWHQRQQKGKRDWGHGVGMSIGEEYPETCKNWTAEAG
eukprot:1156108-Pelagomonas_calceolata.AAC.9